ncbi:uncharacterized protein LOC114933278 [Nylanderia fulva]|uniref:uncharacterized protein LOC114933278 n=1 Tax=Nylanderia fulva TaxID=613905 RepID=UPI0010FB6761|nr:uncharacterized protein LOC114933278 [Nylanderia fulva]
MVLCKKFYDNLFKINKQKESEEYEQIRKKFKKNSNFIEISIDIVAQLRMYMSDIRYKNCDYFNSINNKISFKDMIYDHKTNYVFIYTIVNEPENFMKYLVFIDEIENSLTQSPRRTGCYLTERYCYEKILDKIKIQSLMKEWDELLKLSIENMVLEWGATFAAQSIQLRKNVSYSDIQASLNNIALEVQNYLKEKHPEHSIFGTSAETLSYWKNNNIWETHWNEPEGIQIIDTLNEYIFDKLNFRFCNPEDTNLEYMCIDNVLKTKYGQKIILLTIYHGVARRLGLYCNVIVETEDTYNGPSLGYRYFTYCYENHIFNLKPNLPTNLPTFPMYCIRWVPRYATDESETERCLNIISKKFPYCLVYKRFRRYELLIHSSEIIYQNYDIICFETIREEIMMGAVDLTCNFNNSFQINKRKSAPYLKYIIPKISTEKRVFITRSDDVKFAIGMIVTHHNMCEDNCTGVIIGWEQHTNTYVKFDEETRCNEIYAELDILPLNHCYNQQFRDHEQTNYIILTDNNKICYVNEGSISLTTPRWINNSEIGRYFCKFENTHYVPNETLATDFSLDIPILTAQST